MRNKRTEIDFSKHEVIKTDKDGLLIHYFKKPDTICCAIKFINTNGILAVTGDFGNWIFCREFHPSSEGFVSGHYWVEKLIMGSTQKPMEYDPDGTQKEIEERLKEEDEDLSEDAKEYLNDLLNYVHECEERYMVYAYDNLPKYWDAESIPIRRKLNQQLEVVFDAFDEICRREPKEETK